ncbi:single-stranded DNA-binding protein [Candidatus Dependentiae bacterium]|nr:single-stranded DNA-binding protein [Candidatus Dependentiae bacterium]
MEGLFNLNKVILVGRLTKSPELRYTPKGVAVAHFNLAINNNRRNRKNETLFIDVVAWNKLAEFCAQYFQKGKGIYLEGSLSIKKWQSEDKITKTKIEIVADKISFLEGFENNQADNSVKQPDTVKHIVPEYDDTGCAEEDSIPF